MSNTESILLEKQLLQEVINNDEKDDVIIDIESLYIDESTIEGKNEEFNTNLGSFESKCVGDKEIKNTIHTSKQSEKGSQVIEHFDMERKQKKPPVFWVQFNTMGNPQGGGGGGFDYDPESRNYFVKFVFTLVLIMLLITAIFTVFVMSSPDLRDIFITNGIMIMIGSGVILMAMNYVMVCSGCARVPPCNFIGLLIVTAAMSCLVAVITVRMKTHIILYALIATIVTVAVCIGLACTNFDFTQWYIYIIAIGVVFSVMATAVTLAMMLYGIYYKPLMILILFVSALLNVVLLIMELQMILGGKSVEMSEDDYAMGAYFLYTTIVHFFLNILQLLANLDD